MAGPEHEWLSQYRRGQVDALGKLVEHYRRPLYGFILRMTEGRADADEIFQETWFRAIRSIDTYRAKSFLSWLFRIAHNLIIDRARKAKPIVDIGHGDDDRSDSIEERLPETSIGPDERTAGLDLGLRIREAIDALPLEQREVFLMRTEADLPFKDIAKIQGTSINTALARMQYAVKKLRELLQMDYDGLAKR